MISKYRWTAKRKSTKWALKDDQFFELVVKPCSYCGAQGENFASDGRASGTGFSYTGVDRVVPAAGYTAGNAIPCCWNCNNAKGSKSAFAFLGWARQASEYLRNTGWSEDWAAGDLYVDDQQYFGKHNPKQYRGRPADLIARNDGYQSHRQSVIARGLEDELIREQWTQVVVHPCFYCGEAWSAVNRTSRGGEFKRNGVDRIDSRLGYLLGNVVPCCKQCNYAKRDRTIEAFQGWIERLAPGRRVINQRRKFPGV